MAKLTKAEIAKARELIKKHPSKLGDWLTGLIQAQIMRESRPVSKAPFRNPKWNENLTMIEISDLIKEHVPVFIAPSAPWKHARRFFTEVRRVKIDSSDQLREFCTWLGKWKHKPFDISTFCYFMSDWHDKYKAVKQQSAAPVTIGTFGGRDLGNNVK